MFPRCLSSRFRTWFAPALATLLLTSPALALDNLKILVPAGPGGGWDQHGRALANAMQSANVVKKITIDNKPGAGGTVGLAQFVTSNKGDPNALLVGGAIMVGAIQINKSPVNLSQVTPIARLTGEYVVIAVSPSSKTQSMKAGYAEFAAQIKSGKLRAIGISSEKRLPGVDIPILKEQGIDVELINWRAVFGGRASASRSERTSSMPLGRR